ncbi:MAG: DUF2283 domain-containing protein [Anaerolineales bacterium]
MKPIHFSNHARKRIIGRGATEAEIIETIQTEKWQPALENKMQGRISMKITYDPEVDTLYLEFQHLDEGKVETRQLTEEIIADYAPDGRLAGLEILDAQRVLSQTAGRVIFEIEPALVANSPKL